MVLVALLLGCVGAPQSFDVTAPAAQSAPLAPPAAPPMAPTPPSAQPAAHESLDQALTASLEYLERDGFAWMRGESPYNQRQGCISCHVVAFSLWSHRAAARQGVTVEDSKIDELAAEARRFIAKPGIGRAVTWGQMTFGDAEADGETVAEWMQGILTSQELAGHWRARGQFPDQRRPVAESDAIATMWSVLALGDGSVSSEDSRDSIEAAREWLNGSTAIEGESLEWLAMKALTDSLDSGADSNSLIARLEAEQNPDGGWSWLLREAPGGADDPSNSYTTGVALYALGRLGRGAESPVVSAGIEYLLATQRGDGIWEMPSHLASTLPSEEKDYIYEFWGTAWAVIGLAEVMTLQPTDVSSL